MFEFPPARIKPLVKSFAEMLRRSLLKLKFENGLQCDKEIETKWSFCLKDLIKPQLANSVNKGEWLVDFLMTKVLEPELKAFWRRDNK